MKLEKDWEKNEIMKLGAVTTAWHDEETIYGTLACLESFVEKHFVLLSEKPFFGENLLPDRTEEICKQFPHVEIIKGVWKEHTMRNIGLDLCKDFDWMIGFDADEMMTAGDIIRLKNHLSFTDFDAIGFISKVYWRTTDYRFDPDPDHIKVCVVRTKSNVKYITKQCINSPFKTLNYRDCNITHHHLSWCEPKNILRKVIHYNHANEIDGRIWYNNFYKDWQPNEDVYQPFGTKWKAVYDPLPDELKKYLEIQNVRK